MRVMVCDAFLSEEHTSEFGAIIVPLLFLEIRESPI